MWRVLVVNVVFGSAVAVPPLSDMGLFEYLERRTALKPYAPLFGLWTAAVAYESGLLKNFVLYADSSPTRDLAQKLFFVNIGDECLPTAHEPYCYATPTTVALLMKAAFDKSLRFKNSDGTLGLMPALIDSLNPDKQGRLRKSPSRWVGLCELIEKSMEWDLAILKPELVMLSFLYAKAMSLDDLIAYVKQIDPELLKLSIKDFSAGAGFSLAGEAVYRALVFEREHGFLPAITPSRRGVYLKRGEPFTDCCEASVRSLLSLFTFNPMARNHAQGGHGSLEPRVISFLTREQGGAAGSDEWAKVVSDLPGIIYRKNDGGYLYEIHPSCLNLVKILKQLFGLEAGNKNDHAQGDTKVESGSCKKVETLYMNSSAKARVIDEWQKLCAQLSKKSFLKVDLYQYSMRRDVDADITFRVALGAGDNSSRSRLITLHVRPEHCWLSKKRERSSLDPLIKEEWHNRLFSGPGDGDIPFSIVYCHDLLPDLLLRKKDHRLSGVMLLSHPTGQDCERYNMLRLALQAYRVAKKQDLYQAIAVNLIARINDPGYFSRALCRLVERGLAEHPTVVESIVNGYNERDEWCKQAIVFALLERGAWTNTCFALVMTDFLSLAPDYEESDDGRLRIDNKLWVLYRYIRARAYESDKWPECLHMGLQNALASLGSVRSERLKKLCCLSGFEL